MTFIHGRARHSQSQGSTERANGDIKVMLATWIVREADEPAAKDHATLVEANANVLLGIREAVIAGQAKQASKRITRRNKYLEAVEIGDYVALSIPDSDRSVASAPNILCRIVDIDQNNRQELACRAGVLLFARN